MAKTALAFRIFPSIANMEKRHGVTIGNTYLNEMGCREMTSCVAESLVLQLHAALAKSRYFSILSDGSTDKGTVEQVLMYIIFIGEDGRLAQSLLKLSSIVNGTAEGVTATLLEVVEEAGLGDGRDAHGMVGFGADGAAVNFGRNTGVATRLQNDRPWLVRVHCFNHRLELAVKDAFADTYYNDITRIYNQIYALCHSSPKRTRELERLSSAMGAPLLKPRKANGTRWVQHRLLATRALLSSYPVLVAHLESMAVDPTHDRAKAKGLLNLITSFKFIVHVLLFQEILAPLARLSLAWQ